MHLKFPNEINWKTSTALTRQYHWRGKIESTRQAGWRVMRASLPSAAGKTRLQEPAKSASSMASTGRSSAIQCHRCQGLGHVARECPRKRAYIAIEDGCYVSTSNVEEDIEYESVSNKDQM